MSSFYTAATGSEQLSGTGTLLVLADDCRWTPAPDVAVTATGMGESGVTYYLTGSDAGTGTPGAVFFLNMPPGWKTLTMTVPGMGVVASDVMVFVRAGAASLITLHPN